MTPAALTLAATLAAVLAGAADHLHLWTLCTGVACIAVLLVSPLAREPEARFLSLIMVAVFAVSNLAWLHGAVPDLALVDWAVAIYAVAIRNRRPVLWRRVLVVLAGFQLACHSANEISDSAFPTAYIWALNISFIGELIAVGSGGGIGLGALSLRLLHDLRGLLGVHSPT